MGAGIRLAACLGAALDVIGPCAFPFSDRMLKRTALDYGEMADVTLHDGWSAFAQAPARRDGRLVLFTTRGAQSYTSFDFRPGDTLLFGRESAGVTDEVHEAAEARLLIPIQSGARSLNVITAAAIALGEALRQTGGRDPA